MFDPTANHRSRRAVHPIETVQAHTTQDLMHRRRRQADPTRNPCRTELATSTQSFHPLFEQSRCASRTRTRAARAVHQPAIALATPATPPLVRGLTRDPELIRDMRNRTSLLNPSDQQPSTMQIQPSVSVHKSLPRLGAWTAPTPSLGGSSKPWTVNNVHGQDS